MLELTLRELKIVQLQLQSSNVIHYCLNYHMHHQHCLSWGQKRVPTSGSFTTGASSILSYSMSSKDIHSIHLLHLQNTKAAIRIWQQFEVVLLVQRRSPHPMCRCFQYCRQHAFKTSGASTSF